MPHAGAPALARASTSSSPSSRLASPWRRGRARPSVAAPPVAADRTAMLLALMCRWPASCDPSQPPERPNLPPASDFAVIELPAPVAPTQSQPSRSTCADLSPCRRRRGPAAVSASETDSGGAPSVGRAATTTPSAESRGQAAPAVSRCSAAAATRGYRHSTSSKSPPRQQPVAPPPSRRQSRPPAYEKPRCPVAAHRCTPRSITEAAIPVNAASPPRCWRRRSLPRPIPMAAPPSSARATDDPRLNQHCSTVSEALAFFPGARPR